jgi:hypothetical protein
VNFIYKLIIISALFYGVLTNSIHASNGIPLKVTVQIRLATDDSSGYLNGRYNVDVCIQPTDVIQRLSGLWCEKYQVNANNEGGVLFEDGYGTIILGNNKKQLTKEAFDTKKIPNPHFMIKVSNPNNLNEYISPVTFPIPSTPYAIRAQIAETVDAIDAGIITGTFNRVLVSGDMTVGKTVYISSVNRVVGINKENPDPRYSLDVSGSINAAEYHVNGNPINYAWKRDSNHHLAYSSGNVGIGKKPSKNIKLDISGTLNATAYLINGGSLIHALNASAQWQQSRTNSESIYWYQRKVDDPTIFGKVGIRTSSNLVEALTVSGAIVIGKANSVNPGTIEFDAVADKFYGYIYGGKKEILGGVQISGTPKRGQLMKWSVDNKIMGIPLQYLTVTNNMLGIGTANPTALLTIQGTQNYELLRVTKSDSKPSIVISGNGHIGINREPTKYLLDISGNMNVAGKILINGQEAGGGEAIHWTKGTDGRLYHVSGNVGIGTTEPNSLLELSNITATGDAAITFDIAGTNLITMGVRGTAAAVGCPGNESKESLIISKGSNLNKPIFAFNQNRTGVGIECPKANLHVNGGSGFLITGKFTGEGTDYTSTERGSMLFFYPKKAAFRVGSFNPSELTTIGNYSVAFGRLTSATATASAVVGGERNYASGAYSVVLGGYNNKTTGRYSVAAGTHSHAKHEGTFVWNSNMFGSNNNEFFESKYDNQFIINAPGGVGIGTADTSDAVLTVKTVVDSPLNHIVKFESQQINKSIFITNKGQLSIGLTSDEAKKLDPNIKLKVRGLVNIGDVTSVDTSTLLTIQNNSNGYALKISNPDIPSATFVITTTGNVGIGTLFPQKMLDVSGDIKAARFIIVDSDGKEYIIQPSAGSPWNVASNSAIYYTLGNVGIGTATPNESLLTLSDAYGRAPEITFELNQSPSDSYTMGVVTSNKVFMIQNRPSLNISEIAALIVTNNRVGIGMTGDSVPSATLHVSGNTVIMGNLYIGTTDTSIVTYNLLVNGEVRIQTLYLSDQLAVIPTQPIWVTGDNRIYYTSGNVGIGTASPTERLHVSGNAIVTTLTVSKDIVVSGQFITKEINLSQTTDPRVLKVNQNGRLTFNDNTLDSNLSGDQSIRAKGPFLAWDTDTKLGQVPLNWNETTHQLRLTGNMEISAYREAAEYKITTNVMMGSNGIDADQNAFSIKSVLDHTGGGGTGSQRYGDYTMQKINVLVKKTWGALGSNNKIIGLDIGINAEKSLVNDVNIIGLRVTVPTSNVSSKNYAAIFMGGNVGIGTETPKVALEVAGIISANMVYVSQAFEFNQNLSVHGNALFVKKTDDGKTRVGIGKESFDYELDVSGTIKVGDIQANRIIATTMNIGNGKFVITASGNIGIGIDNPSHNIVIKKTITKAISKPAIAEQIKIEIDSTAAKESGVYFELDEDLTGLEVELRSKDNNYIRGTNAAIGVNIDLRNVSANSSATLVGLDVNVAKNDGATRYAALFNGGNVGIGITPNYELHVSGNIFATQLYVNNLRGTTATYNNLTVHVNTKMVTATVTGELRADNIVAGTIKSNTNTLELTRAVISDLIVTSVNVLNGLSARTMTVGQGLTALTLRVNTIEGSGGKITIKSPLIVQGTLKSNRASVESLNFTGIATLPSVQQNTLYANTAGNLIYATASSPNINLSSILSGTAGKVAVVASSSGLSDSANLYWLTDTVGDTLQVGTANILTKLLVTSMVDDSVKVTTNVAEVIVTFNSRTASARFTGMAITLQSSPNTFLADGDNVTGLKVDVTRVGAYFGNGTNKAVATKNAALFLGGNVGIETETPEALLHIVQTNRPNQPNLDVFRVDTLTTLKALYVSATGNVAIANDLTLLNSTGELTIVGGKFKVNIEGVSVNGILAVNTLKVNTETEFNSALIKETLAIDTVVSPNTTALLVTMNLTKNDYSRKQIKGVNINLSSDPCEENQGPGRQCWVENGVVYGLYVDVRNLALATTPNATISSAVFMGGNVGIGTVAPKNLLTVKKDSSGIIATFQSGLGRLNVESYGTQKIGLSYKEVLGATLSSSQPGILFTMKNGNMITVIGTSNISDSTQYPDAKLIIDGDLRLGTKGSNITATGSNLIFTNGSSNDIKLYRKSYDAQNLIFSELQLDLGDPNNNFSIVYGKGTGLEEGQLHPLFTVTKDGVNICPDQSILPTGIVCGINGKNALYIQGEAKKDNSGSADLTSLKNHLVVMENKEKEQGNILALSFSNKTTNISPSDNFVTFIAKVNGVTLILGEIEGNNGSGVRFKTNGADYAEYLEKVDKTELIEMGDIVGVFHGKVSKSIKGAQQLMVRSSGAAVAGNWPGPDTSGYELIAFFGQVNIKVTGSVEKGDYIIPSGREDGTGVGVSKTQITVAQKQQIVGRAWESSTHQKEKLILCAVGLNFIMPGFDQEMEVVEYLRKEVTHLEKENKKLAVQLVQIKQKDHQIEQLIKKLKE